MTGLKSEYEREYKFGEITDGVYHLANLFKDPKRYTMSYFKNKTLVR